MAMMFGGVLHVYPEPNSDLRYCVRDNADFPDCVDFWLETWDPDERSWKGHGDIADCIPAGVFTALAEAAKMITALAGDEPRTKQTFQVTIEPVEPDEETS